MFPCIVLVYEKYEIGFDFWTPSKISNGSVGEALRVASLAFLQWVVGFNSQIEFPIVLYLSLSIKLKLKNYPTMTGSCQTEQDKREGQGEKI